MEIKYYANTMQDALDKIKKELGPDAIVISSQRVRAKKGLFSFFSPKVYEVVASYSTKNQSDDFRPSYKSVDQMDTPILRKPKPSAAKKQNKPSNNNMHSARKEEPVFSEPEYFKAAPKNKLDNMIENALEWDMEQGRKTAQLELDSRRAEREKLEQLDNKIDQLSSILDEFSTKVINVNDKSELDLPAQIQKLYDNLIEADTQTEVARELVLQTMQILERKPEASEMEAMDHVLREFIGEVNEIEHKKFNQEKVMIIGPTGVGKTTTLVKLASYYVCQLGLKVAIINTDVYRVGAQEQLKTYAEILDVPLLTIYNPEEIPDAISQFSDMDIVFIDTAGKVSNDEKYQKEIEKLIQLGEIDEIYLAVSGSTQIRNLKELFANYAFLERHNIIVTKMDEGSRKGVFLNIRKYSNRPLSYETTGQSVPDDIQKVDVASIISEVLRY